MFNYLRRGRSQLKIISVTEGYKILPCLPLSKNIQYESHKINTNCCDFCRGHRSFGMEY